MKIQSFPVVALTGFLAPIASGQTIWEAYNDHRGGAFTAANTTVHEMRGAGTTGPLRNFATGEDMEVTLTIEEDGATDDFGANGTPNVDSPADQFFANKCTIGGVDNPGIVGVRNGTSTVRLRFSNLDATKRYKFRGTACRGNFYTDRWALFRVTEAEGATAAHTDASQTQNLFTSATFPGGDLQEGEVALNTGDNLEGSLVGWDNINPGEDGTFCIESTQYSGPTPFGVDATGVYGYALNVMYLAAVEPGGGGGVGEITNVTTSGNNISIQWTGAGTLQTSENLSDWSDVTGATSPYSTDMAPGRKFFRLRE